MYTKSIIQQTVEMLNAKNNFKASIEHLMEKYTIEDSAFTMKNGFLHEAVNGYFNVENSYESLDEAIHNCNNTNAYVRVINNKEFQVGTVYKSISECCKDKQIFDLDRLEQIR